MSEKIMDELSLLINDKAKAFGADVAGVAGLSDLKRSPSHQISAKMPEFNGVGTKKVANLKHGIVQWPRGARSAIVIGVAHPPERPELDWWVTIDSAGNTAGNRQLMKTVSELKTYLEKEQGIQCFRRPYHIEHGGVYMKDTAVLAGLGCIGKNNLLITPQFGPRVRLRVMLTDADLPSAGVIDFNPCDDCHNPCRISCPQDAFAEQIYQKKDYGLDELPGRSGEYSRFRCNREMDINNSNFEEVESGTENASGKRVKYCRECELVCPVGCG